MGGHSMHFWEITSQQRGHSPLFVPYAARVDANAEDSRESFGEELLGVPNPDV